MDKERSKDNIEQQIDTFTSILEEESRFPMQNPEGIKRKIQNALRERQPVNFCCFVCLPLDLEIENEKPKYFVGNWKTRLERSKNIKRFQEIINRLKSNNLSFSLKFTIADTDIYDVWGNWLKNPDQTQAINDFKTRITSLLSISEGVSVSKWSDLQTPYKSAYDQNFNMVFTKTLKFVDQEYLTRGIEKRQDFFEQKKININPETLQICEQSSKRNVALYAAQGPIIENLFDFLIIADPDPLRMGKIQSLLAPELGIWYPIPE